MGRLPRSPTPSTPESTVDEARVLRAIVNELPTKDLCVESLGILNVCGQELYVVYTTILFRLAHDFVSR
jgi:hypothetical protein